MVIICAGPEGLGYLRRSQLSEIDVDSVQVRAVRTSGAELDVLLEDTVEDVHGPVEGILVYARLPIGLPIRSVRPSYRIV